MALTTFSDLVGEARALVRRDAERAGVVPDPAAYTDAVATYLAQFLSRMIDLNNSFCQWRSDPAKEHVGHLFARQAIAMVWDYAEANPLGPSAGGWNKTFDFVPKVLDAIECSASKGLATQKDATNIGELKALFSTDPPYYDNVPYADLSDFFYVWLRRSLKASRLDYPFKGEVSAESLYTSSKLVISTYVLRGGSWRGLRGDARCACRLGSHPSLGGHNSGFCLARLFSFPLS